MTQASLWERVHRTIASRRTPTERVIVGPGALCDLPAAVRGADARAVPLVVCDPNTRRAAGDRALDMLMADGLAARIVVLDPECVTDAAATPVDEALAALGSGLPVAVGAGTINDITKLAASNVGVPYVAVATAPSMNGYPSPIAAVLRAGLKCTAPAAPPVAIIYDTDILCAAPPEMVSAGYADMLAKPTSQADWILAREVVGEPFDQEPLALLDGVVEALVRAAPAIARREPDAVGLLCATLTLSGLSMALAGSSQPASGAEHLISHHLDMIGHRDGWTLDLHGRQVGVACLMMAAVYERLLGLRELPTRPAAADAESAEPAVRRVYGPLSEPVLAEMRAKAPTPGAVEQQLAAARAAWPRLRGELAAITVASASMREHLRAGAAPTTLGEIGRSRDDGRIALLWSRAIRRRYTALDLAADLGLLEDWADEIVGLVS